MSSLCIASALHELGISHSELKSVSNLQVGPNIDEAQKFDKKGEKTESGFSSDNFRERGTHERRSTLEYYVFFAAAQEAAEREEEGIT